MKTKEVTTIKTDKGEYKIPLIDISKEDARKCLDVMDEFNETLNHKDNSGSFCASELPIDGEKIICMIPTKIVHCTDCVFNYKEATLALLNNIIKEKRVKQEVNSALTNLPEFLFTNNGKIYISTRKNTDVTDKWLRFIESYDRKNELNQASIEE